MINRKIKPQILLSSLWVFILFNMVVRDLHEFLRIGYFEEMIGLKISQETILFYGLMVELPILMVLLSRILNNKINKWANLIIAGITMLGILSTLPSGDMDDIFFALIEIGALITVMITAWRLTSKDLIFPKPTRTNPL